MFEYADDKCADDCADKCADKEEEDCDDKCVDKEEEDCDDKCVDKIALITGCTGQDGSYLTELLLSKGYIVHGIIRRSSSINTHRIDHLYKDPHIEGVKLFLHYGDMSDLGSIEKIIQKVRPDEVYNLAAMSHVRVSFDIPEYTGDVGGLGTLRVLEAIRKLDKKVKFYQAGTSEMYGGVHKHAQNEDTPFCPRSPYAVAKLYAHWITKNYRESYGLFAVNGILFNHSSPRRGETFVEQKIVKGAVAIKYKKQNCLYLGNLYSYRDIGHSKDFVYAMWLMLQQNKPNDYVIASGEKIMIKEIVNYVFDKLSMKLEWHEEGFNEYAIANDSIVVKIDKRYFRPSEVNVLLGDSTKAKKQLGWVPKYTLDTILDEMIIEEESTTCSHMCQLIR
jgi:GDPmannose 4,6-dehydratase